MRKMTFDKARESKISESQLREGFPEFGDWGNPNKQQKCEAISRHTACEIASGGHRCIACDFCKRKNASGDHRCPACDYYNTFVSNRFGP